MDTRPMDLESALADVMIHIREDLEEGELRDLEDCLRERAGVVSVGHRPGREHLLMLAYDSESETVAEMVRAARGQGYQAEAVGL